MTKTVVLKKRQIHTHHVCKDGINNNDKNGNGIKKLISWVFFLSVESDGRRLFYSKWEGGEAGGIAPEF
jgi:hypothetical protein